MSLDRVAPVLVVVAAIGCGGDSTGPGSIAGTYTLRTIGGQSLPVVVDGREFLSGNLVMRDDGTWTFTYSLRDTPGQGQAENNSNSGRYTLIGTALTFESDDSFGLEGEGSYQNGTIGMDFYSVGGGTWTFRK